MPGVSPDDPQKPQRSDEPERYIEITLRVPLVDLGWIVATPGALNALVEAGVSPTALLRRHVTGDWGELDEEDRAANNLALLTGMRLLSAYTLPKTNERIWIITEWDRS